MDRISYVENQQYVLKKILQKQKKCLFLPPKNINFKKNRYEVHQGTGG